MTKVNSVNSINEDEKFYLSIKMSVSPQIVKDIKNALEESGKEISHSNIQKVIDDIFTNDVDRLNELVEIAIDNNEDFLSTTIQDIL